MKKKISSCLILFLLVSLITIYSYAATGTITGTTVKLREKPNLEGKLITLLSVNNKVEVVQKAGEWYKVTYDGKTGYVHADYVKVEGEVSEEESTNEELPQIDNNEDINNTQDSEKNNMNTSDIPLEVSLPDSKVVGMDQPVYLIPVITSSKIANLKKGETVNITDYINGWAYIQKEGVAGWIRYDKLVNSLEENTKQPEQENPQENEQPEYTSKEMYVVPAVVNLRKSPDTLSEIITKISMNTKVTVIGEQEGWYKVTVSGKEGYISKDLLSDKEQETSSRSNTEKRQTNDVSKSLVSDNMVEVKNTNTSSNQDTSTKGDPESNTSSLVSQIVEYAKQFLGVPYKSGGTSTSGFDCSGFTYYVYKKYGYTLPRTSTAQASTGVAISKDNLQLGDILIYNNSANTSVGHVGIYIGNNQFIHASSPGDYVKITSMSTSYYVQRYVGARRVI